MAEKVPQTRENHERFVPAFHFVASPILLGMFIWSVVRLFKEPSAEAGGNVALLFALMVVLWFSRAFALRAQDRVIRLEEQLRYQRLLPADLNARMNEFTIEQYVSLRFAADAELPNLARTVLDQKLTDQKQIKAMIREWRPDYLRV
jgi:Family of unknown function (DUF6526)